MEKEHQILRRVLAAKENTAAADELIRDYLPFIRAEATRVAARMVTENDDECSIAMMAFYEAVMGYRRGRGAFLPYAALLIRSRLIDYLRKEKRHGGHLSLEESGDGERAITDTVADPTDHYALAAHREATRQEIDELSAVLERFGLDFSLIADHSPRQERTRAACAAAIRCGGEDAALLDEVLRTGKIPLGELARRSGAERKTLERHRKYILAMLLIHTNGYEIIRGHLRRALKRKEGTQA